MSERERHIAITDARVITMTDQSRAMSRSEWRAR
jgi:hypothetical protein